MASKNYQLLVVAHPDDETIFFGGLVLQEKKLPWKLVVLTDGNADGQGVRRDLELRRAAKSLGIKDVEHWRYPDIFGKRLPVAEVAERLKALPRPKRVFTHGPLGEYGHAHHQDCCMASFLAFPQVPIYSPAYNAPADFVVSLDKKQFAKKAKLFAENYFEETKRFIQFLPALPAEGFVKLQKKEVQLIYHFFLTGVLPTAAQLKSYRWFMPYFSIFRELMQKRSF